MQQLQEYLNSIMGAIGAFREANRQLFTLIVATLLLALGIGGALYVINPGAPVVVASNLNPADRTALALRLRHNNIDFTLGLDSSSA